MIKIHLIQTGSVKTKTSQRSCEDGGGLGKILLGRAWTEWLLINAWVIEHSKGGPDAPGREYYG